MIHIENNSKLKYIRYDKFIMKIKINITLSKDLVNNIISSRIKKPYSVLFHLKKPPSLKVVMDKRFYHKN